MVEEAEVAVVEVVVLAELVDILEVDMAIQEVIAEVDAMEEEVLVSFTVLIPFIRGDIMEVESFPWLFLLAVFITVAMVDMVMATLVLP